jgi:hypothetical protein
MPSSVMLQHVALVRTDISEERRASIIRVTRIGELGTTFAVTSNRRRLRRNTKPDSCHLDDGGATIFQKSVLRRTTRRNIPEYDILQYFIGIAVSPLPITKRATWPAPLNYHKLMAFIVIRRTVQI